MIRAPIEQVTGYPLLAKAVERRLCSKVAIAGPSSFFPRRTSNANSSPPILPKSSCRPMMFEAPSEKTRSTNQRAHVGHDRLKVRARRAVDGQQREGFSHPLLNSAAIPQHERY